MIISHVFFFAKKRTLIHGKDFKLRQHNGCCHLKKTLLMGKYLHLVKVAMDTEGILGNISSPLVFRCYLAWTLNSTPLFLQESGHPTSKREPGLSLRVSNGVYSCTTGTTVFSTTDSKKSTLFIIYKPVLLKKTVCFLHLHGLSDVFILQLLKQ